MRDESDDMRVWGLAQPPLLRRQRPQNHYNLRSNANYREPPALNSPEFDRAVLEAIDRVADFRNEASVSSRSYADALRSQPPVLALSSPQLPLYTRRDIDVPISSIASASPSSRRDESRIITDNVTSDAVNKASISKCSNGLNSFPPLNTPIGSKLEVRVDNSNSIATPNIIKVDSHPRSTNDINDDMELRKQLIAQLAELHAIIRELDRRDNLKIAEAVSLSSEGNPKKPDFMKAPTNYITTSDPRRDNALPQSHEHSCKSPIYKLPHIKPFDGISRYPSSWEFLDNIDRNVALFQASEDTVLDHWIPSLLIRDAKRWYDIVQFEDYEDFKERFLERFVSAHYRRKIEDDLYRRSQAQGEPLAAYVGKMAQMLRIVKPSATPEDLRYILARGVEPKFMPEFDRIRPISFDDLVQLADELDARQKYIKERRPPPPAYTLVNPELGYVEPKGYKATRHTNLWLINITIVSSNYKNRKNN